MELFSRDKEKDPNTRLAGARRTLGRLLFIKVVLLLTFSAIVTRLVQVQVIDASHYQEIAKRQHEARIDIKAARGNIFDRQGRILVSNSVNVTFAADPILVANDAQRIAERFSRIFGKPASSYAAKLNKEDRRFVYLERGVRPEIARKINTKEFKGIIQMNEPQRLYHYEHLAGQVIGFTGVDAEGLSGIEMYLDGELCGTDGYVVMQRDGLGRTRPSVDYPRIDPRNGQSVQLTIDLEYQSIVEQELKRGIERSNADGGLAVMMDPSTGEILAMANYPFMNPMNASTTDPALMKNRTITDMFEPGSMFKVVTVTAALEHGVVPLDKKFFAEGGTYVVTFADGTSRKIEDTKPHDMLNLQEAVEVSSNIVMAKVSDLIGAEPLYTTARDFGFGTTTGIDLPGEVRGELKKPVDWSGATLNSLAIGYEVGVTPLQIAAAYSAVANNGLLMKPVIVQKFMNEKGEVIREMYPQTIRRLMKKESAALLREFLVGAVERGTGASAKLQSVRVAGKTGTARKVINGTYQRGYYTASFVGFFPADEPKAVCVVMLDNPRLGGYTGGTTSAPIFKAIAEKVSAVSDRFRISQPLIVGKQTKSVPDVASLDAEAASSILFAHGFKVERTGSGDIVTGQVPGPGTRLMTGETVKLITEAKAQAVAEGFVVVPNLHGAAIRRAINRLRVKQLDVSVQGTGVVVEQVPSPGKQVKRGTRVLVRCSPRSMPVLASR